MEVKTYKLINGLFQSRNLDDHARFSGEQLVVFAADYDALAAELAGYKDSHEKYCPSAARIRELEAALRPIIETAEAHPAKANFVAVHRQLIGTARNVLDRKAEHE